MKCYECGHIGKDKRIKIDRFQYLESGLKNVYVVNLPAIQCPECEAEFPVIPQMEKLHDLIAECLIRKKYLLTKEEIRFLRTHLGYSQVDFSEEVLQVTPTYYNKVEKGKLQVTNEIDRLVRLNFIRKIQNPRRVYEDLDIAITKKEAGVKPIHIEKRNTWKVAA